MKTLLLLACLGTALLTGCATNPYAQNYRSLTNDWPAALHQALLPPSPEPEIRFTTNFSEDGRKLAEKSYLAVGSAMFQGTTADEDKIKAQARAVGADVVLYSSRIAGTERTLITYQEYDPGPVVSRAEALSPGIDPHAAIHKRTVATTSKVFRQGATFWRRAQLGGWGAHLTEIPESLQPKLQQGNTGAYVAMVRENSPAFKAGLLYTDIIIKVGNRDVQSAQQFLSLLRIYPLKKVPLTVQRANKPVELELDMTEARSMPATR